jgi:hypothetical protein
MICRIIVEWYRMPVGVDATPIGPAPAIVTTTEGGFLLVLDSRFGDRNGSSDDCVSRWGSDFEESNPEDK